MSRASMNLQQIQRVTGSAGVGDNGSMFMTEPPSSIINVQATPAPKGANIMGNITPLNMNNVTQRK